MRTFQDFEKASRAGDKEKFISSAIAEHILSPVYQTARDADLYDKQKNRTINEYVRMLFTLTGTPVEDFTASNNKIPSNFFHRLNIKHTILKTNPMRWKFIQVFKIFSYFFVFE